MFTCPLHLSWSRCALFAAAWLASSCALADASQLSTRSGHSLGVSLSGYSYDEPSVMSLKARKIGLDYTGTYALPGTWPRSNEGWFARAELRMAAGKADYRSPISGGLDGTENSYLEARGLLGRDVDRGGYLLSPYVGLGLRHLYNDLRGITTSGATGYRRISQYVSLPIGLTHKLMLEDRSQLHTTLEYTHLIRGQQKVMLSDVAALRSDLRLDQRSGYGLRASMMKRSEYWAWGPTLSYWNIGASESAGVPAFFEPRNKTYEVGLKAAYHF
jgi:hypothetical protein